MSAVTLFVVTGCDEYDEVTGSPGHVTHDFGQAETAIAVSTPAAGPPKVVVAYNDETNATGSSIVYSPDHSSRTVHPGASLMGWSHSTDAGSSWNYGGKLAPPAGWAALWGDPSIDSERITIADLGPMFGAWYLHDFVVMTNLAAPSYRMTGPVEGAMSSVLDGACVAVSWDGGATFSISQCFAEAPYAGMGPLPPQHFYDGSATAVATDGETCVAFHDVTASKVSMWCGNPVWGIPFTFVNAPAIPGAGSLTHPRLDFVDGSLYLAVQRGSNVFISRRVGGGWTPPRQVNAPGHTVPYFPELHLPLPLRTGPQFDFAVGPASSAGYDEVRVLYSYVTPDGHLGMAAGLCPASLSACYIDPAWWTDPTFPANYFNPRIAVSPVSDGQATWKIGFDADMLTGTNTITTRVGTLTASGWNRLLLHYELTPAREVCADDRGYWGDYDDMKFVEFEDPHPQFVITGSDSSYGCEFRDFFLSHHVHVSSMLFE